MSDAAIKPFDTSSIWDLLGQCHVANDRVRQRAIICKIDTQLTPEEDLLLFGIETKLKEADDAINEASKLVKDYHEDHHETV